ncbi:proline racemase family protein [Microtetraspora sp. NBRC 16547]|uniref:proline racemase family protein n=1 Tax=Microtetraspora sp. NBRC 16547 TaxID=3030993 RepID=UPI00249FE5A1|nr:proline racemase family protein [Microtetraspora sp. NBRC 16547]GLW99780.1 proline racemase [Microtetraspora sp. NBRC 16547]
MTEVTFLTSHDVRTVDYHTAGEPFRIVVSGVPDIPGATVLDRRTAATAPEVDAVRRLLCHEPRGHADMYGCFLVPPDDPGAHLGVLFWHKDGYSTACGHGTIALGVYAVEQGLVAADPDGETSIAIDVPSGRVLARVRSAGGRVEAVTFRNVPSYTVARDVPACGTVVDVAYGGAIYASVPAAAFGLSVTPGDLTELIALGRSIKAALAGHPSARHPSDDRLSGIYGVIFHEDLGSDGDRYHQRNVTVFADGEVDRSPCGSGTAARLALLAEDHPDPRAVTLRHEGVAGGVFLAGVADVTEEAGRRAIVPEIEGTAFRTGEHRFTLDPRDPLGTGFTLR